jgi:hypothetical protein
MGFSPNTACMVQKQNYGFFVLGTARRVADGRGDE